MLAQGKFQQITPEHVKHTENYFQSIKQHGYPPNIDQLMQSLRNLHN